MTDTVIICIGFLILFAGVIGGQRFLLISYRERIERLEAHEDQLTEQRDKLLERLHPAATGVLVPIETQEPRGYGTDEDEYDAWERRERQAGRNPEETYHEYSA